jgi:uncharacterized protein YceK
MRKLLVLFALVSAITVMSGCGSDTTASGPAPETGPNNPGAKVGETTGGGGENAVTPTDK